MAKNFTLSVEENFNVDTLLEDLADVYLGKGYTVRTVKMKKTSRVTIEKGTDGLNKILGLGERVTVNLTKQKDEIIAVSFGDEEWMGKIIAGVIGWFLCFIPIITAIIGILKQISLSKDIESNIYMLTSE